MPQILRRCPGHRRWAMHATMGVHACTLDRLGRAVASCAPANQHRTQPSRRWMARHTAHGLPVTARMRVRRVIIAPRRLVCVHGTTVSVTAAITRGALPEIPIHQWLGRVVDKMGCLPCQQYSLAIPPPD